MFIPIVAEYNAGIEKKKPNILKKLMRSRGEVTKL